MTNEAVTKFTWVIKNFTSSKSEFYKSDEFVIAGRKWFLVAYSAYRRATKYLVLFLSVADPETLPSGWTRQVKCCLTVVNHLSDQLSQVRATQVWLDQKDPYLSNRELMPISKLRHKGGGFLVNGEVKIVAEVEVLEVIGGLDVTEESQEVTQPSKRIKLNETSSLSETIDVCGFQVLPSQAEFVKRIFQKHPNMAKDFQAENQHLRTSIMNCLLGVIETLCQPVQDLTFHELEQANNAVAYLNHSGFKVDWLERKLDEVLRKKLEEKIDVTRMEELEEELESFKEKCSDKETLLEKEKVELRDLKHMCSNTEALLNKQKVKVLAATAPLTVDDVV